MVDEYRSAVASMRDAAKWVLTTLGAVGAVLVSGIGLSSVTNLHRQLYLELALGGLVIALLGIGWAIAQTAAVLQLSTVSWQQILSWEPQGQAAKRPSYLGPLYPASATNLRALGTDYADLASNYALALTVRAQALQNHYDSPDDDPLARRADAAQKRAQLFGMTIDGITAQAAYLEVKSRLDVGHQLMAAALVVAGTILFAVTLALPTWKNPDLRGAALHRVHLNGVRLQRTDFSGMTISDVGLRDADLRDSKFDHAVLTRVDLTGANVSGASFTGVTWKSSVCPDGTLSDLDGHACQSHLEARAETVPAVPPRHRVHRHKRSHHRH